MNYGLICSIKIYDTLVDLGKLNFKFYLLFHTEREPYSGDSILVDLEPDQDQLRHHHRGDVPGSTLPLSVHRNRDGSGRFSILLTGIPVSWRLELSPDFLEIEDELKLRPARESLIQSLSLKINIICLLK